MLLYSYLVIESFNFGSLIIKSYNITSYGRVTNLTSYSFLYSLYLFSLSAFILSVPLICLILK